MFLTVVLDIVLCQVVQPGYNDDAMVLVTELYDLLQACYICCESQE